MNKEIIDINQDKDAVAASLVYTMGRNPWACDLLIRPLSDGTFAVALINKDPSTAHTITVHIKHGFDAHHGFDFSGGPAGEQAGASIRDVYAQRDLGNHTEWFNATVPSMDAMLLRFTMF